MYSLILEFIALQILMTIKQYINCKLRALINSKLKLILPPPPPPPSPRPPLAFGKIRPLPFGGQIRILPPCVWQFKIRIHGYEGRGVPLGLAKTGKYEYGRGVGRLISCSKIQLQLYRCGRVDCPPVRNVPPDILH